MVEVVPRAATKATITANSLKTKVLTRWTGVYLGTKVNQEQT